MAAAANETITITPKPVAEPVVELDAELDNEHGVEVRKTMLFIKKMCRGLVWVYQMHMNPNHPFVDHLFTIIKYSLHTLNRYIIQGSSLLM